MRPIHALCLPTILSTLAALAVAHDGPQLVSVHLTGGAGDQAARAVIPGAGRLFLVGDVPPGFESLLFGYSLPPGPTPEWSVGWPNLAGGDSFLGVAVDASGLYAAGGSYERTADLVGGKEIKGIVVKFPHDGATGAGFGGAIWDVQTPPAPGAFPYGGTEIAYSCLGLDEGGTMIYVSGFAQSSGANGGRMWLAKLDSAGALQWAVNDGAIQPWSIGRDLAELAGDVIVAGAAHDSGSPQSTLWRYTPAGAQVWRVSGSAYEYLGVTVFGGDVFAVGRTSVDPAQSDFLVDRWDAAGNLVWSRTFDRGGQDDILEAVIGLGGRLYAVGASAGATAGGFDAVLLEIDPGTGALLTTTLTGGALDDRSNDIATDGQDLYVAGSSRSYQVGGNGAGEEDVMLLRFAVDPSFGDSYCGPVVPNSTGQPGTMVAQGSQYALADHLHLRAADLPALQFGFFLVSQTQGFVSGPGGSQGNLCLGGQIGRFISQAQGTGTEGSFAIEVDTDQLPPPTQSTILPGETWSFQAWYRDFNPTPTSNFTNGLVVTFL